MQLFRKASNFINFNSIKVRLKRIRPRHSARWHGFQFHKGTIKTMSQQV